MGYPWGHAGLCAFVTTRFAHEELTTISRSTGSYQDDKLFIQQVALALHQLTPHRLSCSA